MDDENAKPLRHGLYATQYSHFIDNKFRVPHISLVFREMWDATDSDLTCQ
jgi:hypothetical protein